MSFEPRSVTAFRYAAARFDAATAVAEFDFELIGEGEPLRFTESITFTTGPAAPVLSAEDAERLQRVLALLGAVLGLSYFKAAAPPRVELDVAGLTAEAVEYLRQVLRHGLAEFAYRAGLPSLLDPDIVAADLAPALPIRDAEGAPFVPIGGGKDSVVSVESLRAVGLEPAQFAARRRLDPALLDLNARGALNGHVPVTAMNTLIAVAQSLLLGLGPVVMSNESSASDPTLEWDGESVNHQWSKSLEAERLLSAVLEPQAGLRGASFSLLRPFSELRIARGFAATTRYDAAIVSCNRAFRLAGATPTWCGECDKCRFVFLALAPHLEPERLLGIIGHDLFADEAQLPGFRALLGLGDHKPFECVGEEAESSVAVTLVSRMPRWADSPVIRALLAEAPELAAGDAALEEHILGESEALAVAAVYERARRALV